ncbi:hypothetical protein N7540_003212 [Penicillium herquei]|nr:hypothetical protein N7540_003212 [Penicillium herquei]
MRALSTTRGQKNDPVVTAQEQCKQVTEDELINEVRAIYAELHLVEKKCIGIDSSDRERADSGAELSAQQWQAMISLHRTLLYEHHDLFFAAQHQSETPMLRRRAQQYMMPARMWRNETHSSRRLLESQHKDSSQERKANPRSSTSNHGVRIFEIPCQVADHTTTAFGDYGAAKNFMTEEYALSLGLLIERSSTCKVTIGNGQQLKTVGAAIALFRFSDENAVHNIQFHLLQKCIYNVIIGRPFLKLTKTFSNLANRGRRVKERIVNALSQLPFLYMASGSSAPMFEGSINGQPQNALADSGSQALIMDEDYARSIRVPIQRGFQHEMTLKFADGSVIDTVGMAYNVNWRFGRNGELTSPYSLHFNIMKNAPANVILNGIFLWDTNAFFEYQNYLIENDDDFEYDGIAIHFLVIGIDRRKKLAEMDVNSFSLVDFRYLELVRRGEETDRIATLPAADKAAQQAMEDERVEPRVASQITG